MENSLFLALPTELRLQIYKDIMLPPYRCVGHAGLRPDFTSVPPIIFANRRTYCETIDMYYRYTHRHVLVQSQMFLWKTPTGQVEALDAAKLHSYPPDSGRIKNLTVEFYDCVNVDAIANLVAHLHNLSIVQLQIVFDWPLEVDDSDVGNALAAVKGLKKASLVDFYNNVKDIPLQRENIGSA